LNDDTSESKPLFIGRKGEIDQLFESLSSKRSITVIVGEEGIGKSAILKEFQSRLRDGDPNKYLVGFYDESKELRSANLTYPFVIALESLLEWSRETRQTSDKINETVGRLEKAFVKFIKEKGTDISYAIMKDIAAKVGLKETLEVAKEFLKTVKDEQSATMRADTYVSEHKTEAISSYIAIFESLQTEFKDRSFVLVFDQFESVGKASVDFLIDFLKNMPDRFHIIISFRSEESSSEDAIARKMYEYVTDSLENQGAKIIKIEGMTAEEIGEWIKSVKGISLPLVPDLKRIGENSSGFPMLLNEWINQSKDLNYENIDQLSNASDKRKQVCKYIIGRKKKFGDNESIKKINKMAVLVQPLEIRYLAKFLDTEIEDLDIFLKKLKDEGIFEKRDRYVWFKNELTRRCIEDEFFEDYDEKYKQDRHKDAANFFLELFKDNQKSGHLTNNIVIGCAYHLHEAGMCEESMIFNKCTAQRASYIGDLDLSERCYKRAIDDAEKAECVDEFCRIYYSQEILDLYINLTHNVIAVWGRYDEAYENYQQLLESITEYFPSISNQRSLVLSYMAHIHYIKKEYDQAEEFYRESLSIAESLRNQTTVAEISHGMGMIYYDNKKYGEAVNWFEKSRSIAESLGNKLGVISSSYYIADIYRSKENYDKAMDLFENDLQVAKGLGNQASIAQILNGIANVHYDKKEYDKAIELLKERLSIEKKLGNQSGIAVTLLDIGKTLIKKGMHKEALPYTLKADLILEQLDIPDREDAQRDLRSIQAALGNSEYKQMISAETNNSAEDDL
jgi:tetratricopeptide (TPR) repeat protein